MIFSPVFQAFDFQNISSGHEVEKRVRVRNRAKAMLAFDLNIQLKILTFL